MLVLATSGHVDHGKSALVEALTGTHPDRLKEEQVREMTIDLGFSFFDTPTGQEIGIIDVPGHIDFIENMLAGMGGIDGVLMVIAADEGIMPQTREHLSILNLLGVNQGIIALTKIDLVSDPEWIKLITAEILEFIKNTSLENLPIIPVSARTGFGIKEIISQIETIKKTPVAAAVPGAPRLPIDRIFSLQGFGTIATGTLLDGVISIGDEIEVLPGGYRSKIRGLQVHNKKIQQAFPGNRTAVNLTNIEKGLLKRGDVIVRPGSFSITSLIDVNVNLLDIENIHLQHNDVVNFYVGTSHRVARVRLLGRKRLDFGEGGFLQLEFEKPVCVKNGDRYIIRKASPSITLGGGEIINAFPRRKYKLQDTAALENMKAKLSGSILDILVKETQTLKSVHELKKVINLDEEEIRFGLGKLIEKGVITEIKTGSDNSTEYIASAALDVIKKSVEEVLAKLHFESPARKGFDCTEIAKKLKIAERDLSPILLALVNTHKIVSDGRFFWKEGTSIILSPAQQKSLSRVFEIVDQNPFTPPTFREMDEILGGGLIKDLIKNGQIIQVSPEIVFREKEYLQLVNYIDELLRKNEKITVAAFRDKFQTSRKYIIPFLEHMDRIKKTRRAGDERIRY